MPAHRLLPEPLRDLSLSYSVLCYWLDKGYVRGEFDGQGRPRVIPESEYPVIRTMHALVMLGFTAEYAAKYARTLADHGKAVLQCGDITVQLGGSNDRDPAAAD